MQLMTFYGNTDMGRLRSNNEDTFIIQNIWDENHILAVVIDGVGGYDGGEIASGMAKKQIVEYLENYSNGERLELLKQAVISANNVIFAERKNIQQYSRMSCVLTAVLIEVAERRINMAHVGDTRLYQFADNRLIKLSHDHSWVGYREEIGELTEEEAMKHSQRNIIGRDIGSIYLENGSTNYVEAVTFPLLPCAALLLCSDGLSDMITSSQMAEILRQSISTEEKVNALIAAANNAGGNDNVTVVLVESDFDEDVPKTAAAIDGSEGSENPEGSEDSKGSEGSEEENKEQGGIIRPEEKETQVAHDKHKPKYLTLMLAIFTALVAGFFMGGFFGHKVLPRVFSDSENKDTVVNPPDSVIIKLQNEKDALRVQINCPNKEIKKLKIEIEP